MNDELLEGLKVAIENGSSVDEAKQTFINSGYNPQEVNSAAEMLKSGISDILYPDEHDHSMPSSPDSIKSAPKKNTNPRKKQTIALVIFLIVILLSLLGAITYLFFI